MTRARSRFAILLLLLLPVSRAPAGPPSLQGASPLAAAPGDITEVVFQGEGLREITGLWTSFESETVLVAEEEGGRSARFWIKVPVGEPVGIGGVRIATRNGISSLFLFMIDDLPMTGPRGDDDRSGSARSIALPGAFEGVVRQKETDRYRFAGRKGERVSIEVVAHRLGSPLDPVVRVLDAEGREIAYCDDERGSGADPRFSLTLEHTGEHVMELRDVTYRGGDAFRYRLRVGDFPLVTVAFPLAVPPGRTTCRLLGPFVKGMSPVAIELEEGDAGFRRVEPIAASFPGGDASGFAVIARSDMRELFEKEPNDDAPQATAVELPAALNGRFSTDGDRDVYAFRARKGEHLVFSGHTRRLSSPADLFLRLESERGAVVAEAEDSGPHEGTIDHAFSEEGRYRLVVEELLRRGGPEFVYRVEVRRHVPHFALRLETEKLEAVPGGEFKVEVECVRKGYDGPIEIELAGDGGAMELSDAVIPKGKKEAVIRGRVPASWSPGTFRTVRFTGVARRGEGRAQEVRRVASTVPALESLFPRLRFPPPMLDGLVGVGVVPASSRERKGEE